MARKIETRWKISTTLTALTPLHVGSIGGDVDTDLALAVNGRGHYYLPGTSLAGALRGWMAQSRDLDQVRDYWGDHDSEHRGASFILVEDAEITLGKGQRIEIREGVGIDRYTGAAAEGFKYNRAILPKGVSIPLEITLDCQKSHDPAELWQVLQALEQGDIRIGAAKTRGLGKVQLTDIQIHRQDLNSADGLFEALLDQVSPQDWNQLRQAAPYLPPARLNFTLGWEPRDPVMVKTEGDGLAVDILPLVSQVDAGVRFVIPGSSIKGVLRAHAERIVRTVCHLEIDSETKFNQQLQVPLVEILFGSAEKNEPQPNSKKPESQGKIGALAVDDCYATLEMTASNWAAVENTPKAINGTFTQFEKTLATALGGRDKPFQTLQPAMHVAIDRWTGGAADSMLYSVLEPIGVSWESIGLFLDVDRLCKYHPKIVKPAIALLLLVLRDFAHRKIPIGYGTNRGMGTVKVTEMVAQGTGLNGLDELDGEKTITPNLDSLDDSLLNDLTQEWQKWVDAQKEAT
ncbi:RAMP superfamily CRISPR-associated protein [Nodosilinea sp. P-1105]|uniref:RAMP superfamily CRISPR-associated protein n=1 Tax=Nodosilinea sp. P-1105 TaxID=2546229 RepID=UPI00146B6889|nr:RAMP superfamily CRISPR-associated protein [Nodosilinea sp. P-1105]NMF84117.1 hypothetical protein [Nodosilinea sp. P-1105]